LIAGGGQKKRDGLGKEVGFEDLSGMWLSNHCIYVCDGWGDISNELTYQEPCTIG